MSNVSVERQRAFLLDLTELTRKHGLTLAECCGGNGCPFIIEVDLDERAGYTSCDDGSSVQWISPKDEYYWREYADQIVRATGETMAERETTTDETLGSGEVK